MLHVRQDLLPLTEKSEKIRKLIRARLDMSYRSISQKSNTWSKAEQEYRAYRVVDDKMKEAYKKNQVQDIIVPIQFATIQTMITFMMEMFTAIKPVLRVRGADPASVRGARIMELALDYDYRGNRGYFMLQQWFLNCFRYGYGIMENSWGKKQILKRQLSRGDSPGTLNIGGMELEVPGEMRYENSWFTTFEGNIWQLVDPRQWFPDPRVPISRFQEGEFCGRRSLIHDNELYKLDDQGIFFNTKLLAKSPYPGIERVSEIGLRDDSRDSISPETALVDDIRTANRNKMHVNEQIIVELIPRDYGLSEEDRPEQWIFNLIDGQTVVRAEPNPFYGFNYSVIESYPDMLAFMSQGVMELSGPLAEHLTFLFNSHMANVRKAVNDMLVFDPSRIEISDLLDPNPGKLIRLLPAAYGTDPAAAVRQLQVMDVTQGHIQDAQLVMDLWQRITGVSDSMFGQISPGRRSALELQGVMRSAASRMKMFGDLASSEGIAPLTEMMALTRQENMTTNQFFSLVGRSAQETGIRPEDILEGFVQAGGKDVSGVFSFPAEEGVLPQDRQAAAQILQEVFKTVAGAPFLASVFDPVEIFRSMVRQQGLHNIDDFLVNGVRAKINILEDQRVRELLMSGKVAPMQTGRPAGPGGPIDEEGLDFVGAIEGAGAPSTA